MNLGRGIFVAGTDTCVGKTVVAAVIARSLKLRGINVGVMKPIETGVVTRDGRRYAADAEFLINSAGVTDSIELVCPVMLEAPLAPSVAARREGKRVAIEDALPAFELLKELHDFVVVEAAGGLGVPINSKSTMRDLAAAMDLPVLIVARPGLGTLNHTLLTAEYARNGGLTAIGIVISNYPEQPNLAEATNPEAMEELTGLPLLGIVKHDPEIATELGKQDNLSEAPEGHHFIDRLQKSLSDLACD
jgi:dethiobiotin synthetase